MPFPSSSPFFPKWTQYPTIHGVMKQWNYGNETSVSKSSLPTGRVSTDRSNWLPVPCVFWKEEHQQKKQKNTFLSFRQTSGPFILQVASAFFQKLMLDSCDRNCVSRSLEKQYCLKSQYETLRPVSSFAPSKHRVLDDLILPRGEKFLFDHFFQNVMKSCTAMSLFVARHRCSANVALTVETECAR